MALPSGRHWAAVLVVVAVCAGACAVGGATAAPADEPQSVTLPTGETVRLHDTGGNPQYEPVEGTVTRLALDTHTYLLPAGSNASALRADYDRALFAVDTLRAASQRGAWPVVLETNRSVATLDRLGLQDVDRLASGTVRARLPLDATDTVAAAVQRGAIEAVRHDAPVTTAIARPAATGHPPATPPGSSTNRTDPVRVAIVDSGIDQTHPALQGQVIERVDLTDRQPNASAAVTNASALDGAGHGTMVAGVVAGNAEDYTGVAPEAALIDIRVFDETGSGRASTVAAGIEYAVREAEADIILTSLGYAGTDGQTISEAIAGAHAEGAVVVASAGNRGGRRSITAPGIAPEAITVGSSHRNGVATHSSRGPTPAGHLKPELLAPGGGQTVPMAGGGYATRAGTSFAAAHVAGVSARLLAAEPTLTPTAVEDRLVSTARPLPGADVYAQGGGVVNATRALDPHVVIDGAVADFGLVTDDTNQTRTITVRNVDTQPHTLTLALAVENVDHPNVTPTTIALNRSRLSLAPNETAPVSVQIDPSVGTTGAYSGAIRYRVNGSPRTAVTGYVRGGVITVDKRPLSPNGTTDGDAVLATSVPGDRDAVMTLENGTATFAGAGGEYLLVSTGVDRPTGTLVAAATRVQTDRSRRVVLDERETVPVGIDAAPLREVYGRLANLSVTASLTAEGSYIARSRLDAPTREVRVTPRMGLDVATTYQLATTTGTGRLDASDVFHLGHRQWTLYGRSIETVSPSELTTRTYRVRHTATDETPAARDQIDVSGVWNQRPLRWFSLGDRHTQSVHRYPSAPRATYTRALRSDAWATTDPGGTTLTHPFAATVTALDRVDGRVRGTVRPFTGSDDVYRPRHTSRVLAAGQRIEGPTGRVSVPIRNDTATLRVSGSNPDARLSTRTQTTWRLNASRLDRRPQFGGLRVPAANDTNAVTPGRTVVRVPTGRPDAVTDLRLWYRSDVDIPYRTLGATNTTPTASHTIEPPWVDATGWEEAPTGRTLPGWRGTITVPETARRGTVSLAAELHTSAGTIRTMTVDAVHVRPAPNTSTRLLAGQLTAGDGPAANDSVLAEPTAGGDRIVTRTNATGHYELEVPRNRTYTLTYVRGSLSRIDRVGSARPLVYPLQNVTVREANLRLDTDIPAGRLLRLSVSDERGISVPNASVTLTAMRQNASFSLDGTPDADGWVRANASADGIRLAGPVRITVTPPADRAYPDTTVTRNITLDSNATPRVERIVLPTRPPNATVMPNREAMLAGTPVRLDARESDVPAGAAEYRWDFTGNGTIDRVTSDPEVRYTPPVGTHHPRVVVVDRAGKRATASTRIRVVSPE